jgi:uncharacterized protein YegJ (DUF2314 family)
MGKAGGGARMKTAAALILGGALVLTAACDRGRGDPLIYPKNEKAVQAAAEEARANLPAFWKAYDAAPSKTDFTMKVAMPTSRGGVEHIWMDVRDHRGDEIDGTLANEPVDLPNYRIYSKVTVKPAQVSDWAYPKDGKFYGHFTTRVLMSQVSAEERVATLAMLWPTALEPSAN